MKKIILLIIPILFVSQSFADVDVSCKQPVSTDSAGDYSCSGSHTIDKNSGLIFHASCENSEGVAFNTGNVNVEFERESKTSGWITCSDGVKEEYYYRKTCHNSGLSNAHDLYYKVNCIPVDVSIFP